MDNVIITIGRENGSGGREVGQILSRKLGLECYDRQIVEESAVRAEMTVKKAERMEENPRTGSKLFFGGIPSANPLFEKQSEIIREFAKNGPCIFVGRCADYVLRNRDDVVNVFITAPISDRINRSAERNGTSAKDAYAHIIEKDTARADYYLRYTGRSWGSASNYHVTLNSGPIGTAACADLIIEYIDRI